MFFEKEMLLFTILDVRALEQKNVRTFNSGRNFNALSFRFRADAHLTTQTSKRHMRDNSVAYVPARLDYTREAAVDSLIVVHFDTMNYHTENIECFDPKNPEVLAQLFKKILACWNKKEIGYQYKCAAILYEIFAECYAQNFKTQQKNSKIQNSVEYMLENYKNSALTISEIAKQSFMSEVYFRKLFKMEFGTSPQKYLINLRIQHAVGLISTGYYSLKEIAYMSGYNDYKYFSVEFKKVKGVSPSEYLYNYQK